MTKREQLIKLFSSQKFLSLSVIKESGIPSQFVTDLVRTGEIVRVARGLYSLPDTPASETEDSEIISSIVPRGVICLISALRFYKLTDENPFEISIALPKGYHAPLIAYPPMKFFAFSEAAFREAAEQNRIDYNVLWRTAKICRVSKIIRPYLEVIK